MDTFKTWGFIEGEGNAEYLFDTISIGERWWLVATWTEGPAKGERTPERIVLLGQPSAGFFEDPQPRFRFRLVNSIPKSVLDGEEQDGYVVRDYQQIVGNRGSSSLH